jgi:helicase required for RNAi-mediated heterochromatin assembly 1
VVIEKDIIAPLYLEEHPYMDLSVLRNPKKQAESLSEPYSQSSIDDDLQNVNVLKQFPAIPESGMDSSQQKACEMMLTKRVAVVQGPPGTGKTHVSVAALKGLIASSGPDDPPIIVAAQTNHALDQLLGHIHGFDKRFVRLGSRCDKNNAAISERTLYELQTSNPKLRGFSRQGARLGIIKRETNVLIDNIKSTLLPLTTGKILTSDILMKHAIISVAKIIAD